MNTPASRSRNRHFARLTRFKFVQRLNAHSPTRSTDAGKSISVSALQPRKQRLPRTLTVGGISTPVISVHSKNAKAPSSTTG